MSFTIPNVQGHAEKNILHPFYSKICQAGQCLKKLPICRFETVIFVADVPIVYIIVIVYDHL